MSTDPSTTPPEPQPAGAAAPGAAPAPGPPAEAAPGAPAAAGPPPLPPAEPKLPITESRPEILVGAALAGGFVLAKLLGRVRG